MIEQRNLVATSILDWEASEVRNLALGLRNANPDDRDYLRAAHAEVVLRVAPIYTVDERQPASVTLGKERGSCSQRMAVLEALARAAHIGTRVRVLWVSGAFWYPRFSAILRMFIPDRVLLLWPQFWLDEQWIGIEEVEAPLKQLASAGGTAFRNNGETLFEAVTHVPVDFTGVTCEACGNRYDLSRFVVGEDEPAAARNDALDRYRLFQSTWRGRIFEVLFGGRASWSSSSS